MGCERIDTIEDPRVDEYRAVRDAGAGADPRPVRRRRTARRRAADRRWAVHALRSVLVSDAARQGLAPSLARLPEARAGLRLPRRDLRGITGFDLHRGCLALVERPAPVPAAALVAPATLVVALDGVGNADNVGGVFRNAAAFGVDAVLLGPTCCDPLYRKAIRTSMARDAPRAVRAGGRLDRGARAAPRGGLRDRRADAAGAVRGSRRVRRAAAPGRLALLVGAEGAGLTSQSEAAADYRVRIAIRPDVDSLNLAVAAGIALERLASRPKSSG